MTTGFDRTSSGRYLLVPHRIKHEWILAEQALPSVHIATHAQRAPTAGNTTPPSSFCPEGDEALSNKKEVENENF